MFFAKTFILLSFTAAMTAAAARTHGLMRVMADGAGIAVRDRKLHTS